MNQEVRIFRTTAMVEVTAVAANEFQASGMILGKFVYVEPASGHRVIAVVADVEHDVLGSPTYFVTEDRLSVADMLAGQFAAVMMGWY